MHNRNDKAKKREQLEKESMVHVDIFKKASANDP